MVPTKTKTKTISYSAVQTYLMCPLKYKLFYVDELKPQFTTDSLLLGHAIHRTLEACLKKYQTEEELMSCVELQRTYQGILRYELNHNEVRYKEGWHPDKLRRMGMNMLSFWHTSFQKDILSINKVIAVEERFCLEAINPDTGWPLSRKITGVIDLVLKLQRWKLYPRDGRMRADKYPGINGTLLIDHKTAIQRYTDFTVDRSMQLTLYQWAAIKLGLIPDRNLTMVGYSVLHKKMTPEFHLYLSRRSEYQETQMLKLFARVLDSIEMGLFYPNLNQIHCRNCSYLNNYCFNW